ncbi:MAG: hypothetical protein GY821_03915 [Gammaproteobacteria bacterium]|nr:hypothetical protein [Gammaproteobacteria bacterium]
MRLSTGKTGKSGGGGGQQPDMAYGGGGSPLSMLHHGTGPARLFHATAPQWTIS